MSSRFHTRKFLGSSVLATLHTQSINLLLARPWPQICRSGTHCCEMWLRGLHAGLLKSSQSFMWTLVKSCQHVSKLVQTRMEEGIFKHYSVDQIKVIKEGYSKKIEAGLLWCWLHECLLISSGASHVQEALDDLENAQSTIRGWKSRPQLNSYIVFVLSCFLKLSHSNIFGLKLVLNWNLHSLGLFSIAVKVRNERRNKSRKNSSRRRTLRRMVIPRAQTELKSIKKRMRKRIGKMMSSMGSRGMRHMMVKSGMAGMVRNGVGERSSKKIRPGVWAF